VAVESFKYLSRKVTKIGDSARPGGGGEREREGWQVNN
jgi:hypothetical protein